MFLGQCCYNVAHIPQVHQTHGAHVNGWAHTAQEPLLSAVAFTTLNRVGELTLNLCWVSIQTARFQGE